MGPEWLELYTVVTVSWSYFNLELHMNLLEVFYILSCLLLLYTLLILFPTFRLVMLL